MVPAAVSIAMGKIHRSMTMEEKGVKDILREEVAVRLKVVSEVAEVFMETTGELVAVEVTLWEVEVLMRIFPVGEEEDLLTMEPISKMNVATIALVMVR